MICFFFLVIKYQDSNTFQAAMDFMFNPDADFALPIFWQENRMVLLAGIMCAVIACYLPTWSAFRDLMQIYGNSPEQNSKPPISPVQACYYYRQDQVSCLVAWLISLCGRGVISLGYKKGRYPWSLIMMDENKADFEDKKLLGILFESGDVIHLKPSFSDPDPVIEQTAKLLFNHISKKYSRFFRSRQSSLLAWLLLAALFAEIPFYMASLGQTIPATLPVTLFSTIITVAPVYVFCHYLVSFFNGPKIIAAIILILSLLFMLFVQNLLYSSGATASYWTTALYPNITAAIIMLVNKAPLMPQDNILLPRVIGYRKHLNRDDYRIEEVDLPWTLGLGVQADIIGGSFHYGGEHLPIWLRKTSEDNVQILLKALHQTFAMHVNQAVYGEMDSKMGSHSGPDSRKGL